MQGLEATIRDGPPLSPGEDVNPLKVVVFRLDLPPFDVGRQFSPHGPAPSEKEQPAESIFLFVGQVGQIDEFFKLLTVMVKFSAVVLRFQELGHYFRFRNFAQFLHVASLPSSSL